jgi:5,10-methylenetetrahydrofolate reductase
VISGSNLEQVLTSGQFTVTGELGPPQNGNFDVVRDKARILKGHVDAVNITDCQTAIVRMSSLAAGLIALAEGVEPVMQMTCRDRNRIGIQSDILGASALGIKNLLCLTGDHQKFGNHPQAKGVFDMDSIQLLGMVKAMRDDKKFQCGDEIKSHEPRLLLGAAANPFADPFEYRPIRVAKKVEAGASFIQTQIIYNVEKFGRFMEMVRDLGLHEKVYILAGVTPPKSVGMARYMKKFVPGLDVPDDVIERMNDAKDRREEGINICVDIIQRVRDIPGVAGVHIMAIGWEEAVPEIVSLAGLSPRPGAKAVEPRLRSSEAIELIASKAEEDTKAEIEKAVEQVKAEAQASRDLVVKEKERIASEISGLKRQAKEAKAIAGQKKTEIERLTVELAKPGWDMPKL